jgi:hypothetical protein
MLRRGIGDHPGTAQLLRLLGALARDRGDYPRAVPLYAESLACWQELADEAGIAPCLEGIGAIAATLGRAELGARLYGAAEALREAAGAPVANGDRAGYDRGVAEVQGRLAWAAFAAAWAAGRALPVETAIAEALAVADQVAAEGEHGPAPTAG